VARSVQLCDCTGEADGVKFIVTPSNLYSPFKEHEVGIDKPTDGNLQHFDMNPKWTSDDFTWVGTANMLSTSGEKLTFSDGDGPTRSEVWFRTVSCTGGSQTNDDNAGLLVILGVEGSEFNKDE